MFCSYFSQTPDTPSAPSTPVDVTDAFQYKLEQAAVSPPTFALDNLHVLHFVYFRL